MDSLTSKNVLVTGATGFIGRHLVSRLLAQKCEVTCLVRSTSHVGELRRADVSLITSNLDDKPAIERVLADVQPQIIFHVAGLVRAIRREEFRQVNVEASATLAAACAACTGPPVLVVVSSLAAAGPCGSGQPRAESDEPAPVSAYGRSKLAGERAALAYADGVPITIVRPPIVFGPGDHGVLQMMKPIHRWGVHLVPGRGAFRLSLVHVEDLIGGMLLAAERGERAKGKAEGSGVYFLSSDEYPTYAELGRMLATALDRSGVRVARSPRAVLRLTSHFADVMARVRGRPAWLNSDKVTEALAGSWMCSSVKAREHLGWASSAPLIEHLKSTARWHRNAGWL